MSWSFILMGGLQAYHISKGYRGALREHGQADSINTLLWPHQSSLIPPRKEFTHTSKAIVFATFTQGTLLDLV